MTLAPLLAAGLLCRTVLPEGSVRGDPIAIPPRNDRLGQPTGSALQSGGRYLVDIGRTGAIDIDGANWNNNSPTKGTIELWLNGTPTAL